MNEWQARRSSVESEGFLASAAAAGVKPQHWDAISPDIENVLCGADRALLDMVFPEIDGVRRLALIATTQGYPSLRLAFCLDERGDVLYLALGIRE